MKQRKTLNKTLKRQKQELKKLLNLKRFFKLKSIRMNNHINKNKEQLYPVFLSRNDMARIRQLLKHNFSRLNRFSKKGD